MSWWLGEFSSNTAYRNRERYRYWEREGGRDRERQRQTDFVDKLVHVTIANNYNHDESGSLHSTAQRKSSYLKILKVQTKI
jgi:hypothetical protein